MNEIEECIDMAKFYDLMEFYCEEILDRHPETSIHERINLVKEAIELNEISILKQKGDYYNSELAMHKDEKIKKEIEKVCRESEAKISVLKGVLIRLWIEFRYEQDEEQKEREMREKKKTASEKEEFERKNSISMMEALVAKLIEDARTSGINYNIPSKEIEKLAMQFEVDMKSKLAGIKRRKKNGWGVLR